MLVGLPLLGVALSGQSLSFYIELPPLTQYVVKPAFSWPLFLVAALIDLILLGGLLVLVLSSNRSEPRFARSKTGRFPGWGWAGFAIVAGGWFLAWSRMSWFAVFQRHTFALPWIGYILVANALCYKRSSRCLMLDDPVGFLLLFPCSALFWWFFEFLNRFVQNWYYVGIENFSPAAYIAFASLSFATVLPAVLSTHRYLMTFPVFNAGLSGLFPYQVHRPKAVATATLIASAVGLALIGVLPNQMFPVIWVAPLLIFSSLQVIAGQDTVFKGIEEGNWRSIVVPALSALICGFFWEMWNMESLAKWHYSIPYVNRFRLFEMPLLGYGGYLPFGLECLVAGRLVVKAM